MKAIQLDIYSYILAADGGEPEIIDQQLEGRLERKGETWILRYVENAGNSDQVRTTVKAGPEEVTVIRQGMIAYRQTYRPGETTYSMIETPGGTSEMKVETENYSREDGHIRFSFRLSAGEEPMGLYRLDIRWTEVSE